MSNKKLTPGKWMGVLAFVTAVIVLIGLVMGYVIGMVQGVETGINVVQIVNLTSLIFVVTWGAVFGSGMMDKYKGQDYKKVVEELQDKVDEIKISKG